MKKIFLGSLLLGAALVACGTGNTPPPPPPVSNPPTVSLSSSRSALTFSGAITLTATATDAVGVTKVEFYDGSTKLGEKTAAPYTYKVELKNADNGTKNYTAKAFNTAGNTATSSPATTVTVNMPTPGFHSLGAELDIVKALGANTTSRSLALDSNGNPVVAWGENANIYVKRWNGTITPPAWEQIGLPLNTNAAGAPSLALDSSGNPVVAWQEDDGSGISSNIYVKRWNGSSWVEFSSTSTPLDVTPNKNAKSPSLALDSSGTPVVAWSEANTGTPSKLNIIVKRWNSATSAWLQIGSSPNINNNNDAESPSLALESNGNPVVAWREFSASGVNNINVKRWNSTFSLWVPFGSSSNLDINTLKGVDSLSLVLDSSGNPIVAWSEVGATNFNIYVKRWNSTITPPDWEQVGGVGVASSLNFNPAENAKSPSLALDSSGNPVVAWHEQKAGEGTNIYVRRWNGALWGQVGSTPLDVTLTQGVESPSLALDSSDNPFVAWSENDASSSKDVYVKRFSQ